MPDDEVVVAGSTTGSGVVVGVAGVVVVAGGGAVVVVGTGGVVVVVGTGSVVTPAGTSTRLVAGSTSPSSIGRPKAVPPVQFRQVSPRGSGWTRGRRRAAGTRSG